MGRVLGASREWALCILLGAALLAGCAGTTPEPRYYRLVPEAVGEKAPGAATPLIGVWPLETSAVLDRTAIVTYAGDHRVAFSGTHQWAGGLQENAQRVLLHALERRLKEATLVSLPQDGLPRPDYLLRIRVEELAGPLGGNVRLAADWQLQAARAGVPVADRLTLVEASGEGFDAYVATVNRLLIRLAEAIAAEVQQHLGAGGQP